MASRYAFAASLIAAALLAGAPSPAPAQCRLCPEPTTRLTEGEDDGSIRLEVQAALDFDRLILLGSGEGTATLLPNGDRAASGTVASLSASAMVGSVTVRGEAGRMVRIELPRRISLYSVNGGSISIDSIQTDLPGLPKLDSAGNLSFRFGGRIQVSGEVEGQYRGDVPITVDYL